MQQKRQYERFSVDFMDIHGKILFRSDVRILNISVGGVSFHSDKLLKIGGTYVLRLESKGTILHLQGIVIWTKLNETSQKKRHTILAYAIGMKFTHVSANRQKEIKQFIQDNLKDHNTPGTFSSVINDARIHIRFLINEPEKAMIRCAEDYKVKKIGQSGMLIESDSTMPIEDVLPMEMTLAENKPITLWGKIVTCEAIEGIEPPRYKIGIEFIDMSEKDNNLLKEFIASFEK